MHVLVISDIVVMCQVLCYLYQKYVLKIDLNISSLSVLAKAFLFHRWVVYNVFCKLFTTNLLEN